MALLDSLKEGNPFVAGLKAQSRTQRKCNGFVARKLRHN
jgi:hypothetical protein